MINYLSNQIFLNELDKLPIRKQHLRLTLLDFQERTIREIAGVASGNGTLNLNGASTTRRTISFNMIADENTNNLTNIDNLISMNKKFKLSIGLENPLTEYKDYGDIIWFPLGTYVISKASLALNATQCSISISGKDKSCMLDGSVGGTLPTTVTLHEIYEYTNDGNYKVSYPIIRTIIEELVFHYGKEPAHNIIISDLDDQVKKLVKYTGDEPMWLETNELTDSKNVLFSETTPKGEYAKYSYGDDVGYTLTDFTYPGELIASAGETVASVLTKIVNILGNYEWFYDIDGRFIFRRKPIYEDVSFSVLYNGENNNETYIRKFFDSKYAYVLNDAHTIVSINNNPNYDNFKNDFIVWGQRPLTGDATKAICYRLTIDDKPELNLCKQYMYKLDSEEISGYYFSDSSPKIYGYTIETRKVIDEKTGFQIDQKYIRCLIDGKYYEAVAGPGLEWREELYRAALQAAAAGTKNSIYDTELLAFWRENYNPGFTINEDNSIIQIEKPWVHNPADKNECQKINYWLDFIDTSGPFGKYSISNIGVRTKVLNSNEVRTLINPEVPDVIYTETPKTLEDIQKTIQGFKADGQRYCFLTTENYEKLITSSTGSSAYDMIRELLYKHLVYNTQVTITSVPKYYLEPNNLIYIQNQKSAVIGEYVINSLTIPLGYNGTMNITANEALNRV